MALVTSVSKDDRNFKGLHNTEVTCFYMVGERDGQKVLQLNTYGSSDREIPGKLSQTIQFSEQSAADLFALLKREYGFE